MGHRGRVWGDRVWDLGQVDSSAGGEALAAPHLPQTRYSEGSTVAPYLPQTRYPEGSTLDT